MIVIAGFDTPAPRESMEKWSLREFMRTSSKSPGVARHEHGEFPAPSGHSSHEVFKEEMLQALFLQ